MNLIKIWIQKFIDCLHYFAGQGTGGDHHDRMQKRRKRRKSKFDRW